MALAAAVAAAGRGVAAAVAAVVAAVLAGLRVGVLLLKLPFCLHALNPHAHCVAQCSLSYLFVDLSRPDPRAEFH